MQNFTAAAANTMMLTVIARANHSPIVAGTITFHLIAITGSNAGKWFKTSDDTWSATEQTAATATHKADGHWSASIDAAAWVAGTRYRLYAKESGNLHVPVSDEVLELSHSGVGSTAWVYTLSDEITGEVITFATVWVSTDIAGTNVIARGTTSTAGTVTFYLDAGTYYVWRSKDGYSFTNPDQETV